MEKELIEKERLLKDMIARQQEVSFIQSTVRGSTVNVRFDRIIWRDIQSKQSQSLEPGEKGCVFIL